MYRIWGFIALLMAGSIAIADHLVGGEISYEHLTGTRYRIDVTLYRDCNGSRLGGSGGGGSSDHLELKSVHLATVPGSDCGSTSQYLGKLNLTKLPYSDVTQVCPGTRTACAENSNFSYGIEAHRYTAEVDFDAFSSASGCNIRIYVSISDRSDELTTLSGGTNYYNYAIINPWHEQVSSPRFESVPKFLYSVNKPFRGNSLVRHNSGDSLSFKWASPLKAVNDPLIYSSGFNKQKFITPYCPSGDCSSDPYSEIPQGIYLNPSNGNYAFTPTVYGEVGAMVIEVEQWRNINGSMELAGIVRQDAMVAVFFQNNNNDPEIIADDLYEVCVGDQLEFVIAAEDVRTTLPDGNLKEYDSVHLGVISGSSYIVDSSYLTSSAPYMEHLIRITATEAMIGTHYLLVKARDNNCPSTGTSQKMIRIVVHPLPQFDFSIEDKFCGNNLIQISSADQAKAFVYISTPDALYASSELSITGPKFDYWSTFYEKFSITYKVELTNKHGCSNAKTKSFANLGNSSIQAASVNGELSYCPNDDFELTLEHSSLQIHQVSWEMNGETLSTTDALNSPAQEGTLEIYYSLAKDTLYCEMNEEVEIDIIEPPIVQFDPIDPVCQSEGRLELSVLTVSHQGGIWSGDIPLKQTYYDLTGLANEDREYELIYSYEDPETGCASVSTQFVSVKKSPDMKLRDIVLCGSDYTFRLSNAIVKPMHFTPENITWMLEGSNEFISGSHPYSELDIPSLGIGQYNIIATNTATNGCRRMDTSWIRVDEGLSITSNGKSVICQGNSAINLVEYLEINAPGGMFSSMDAFEMLEGNMLTPSSCGTYELHYTYDSYGCYAQASFTINIICAPELILENPSQVCENTEPLKLKSNTSGLWEGIGVTNGIFDPRGLAGSSYQLQFSSDPVSGCVFTASQNLEVLPAASVSILNLPDKLCEDEELHFELKKDMYSELSFDVCGDQPDSHGEGQYLYHPAHCDLVNGQIRMDASVSSAATCPISKVSISIPYLYNPSALPPDPLKVCFPHNLDSEIILEHGQNVQLNYSIYNENTQFSGTGSNLYYEFPNPGIYSLGLEMMDANGCSSSQVFENVYRVDARPFAAFDLSNEGILNLSERELYLYNYSKISQGSMTYIWTCLKGGQNYTFSTATNPFYELPLDTGKFDLILTAVSNHGCTDTAVHSVIVVPDMVIFVPTAFSPDQEGPEVNNAFKVTCVNAQTFHIQIYNKWGQMVFESYDINETWDGTIRHSACPMGVYIYRINIVNHSGIPFEYNGTLNLLR